MEDVSKSICHGEHNFFKNEGEVQGVLYKNNSVYFALIRSIVFQEGIDRLIFYIFEYGAEYGAECSAESGAKQYFIHNHMAQWNLLDVINSVILKFPGIMEIIYTKLTL